MQLYYFLKGTEWLFQFYVKIFSTAILLEDAAQFILNIMQLTLT